MIGEDIWIDYTNHRGVRRWRHVRPVTGTLSFWSNEWHPQTQWLFDAMDLDLYQRRTFALASVHGWRMTAPDVHVYRATPAVPVADAS